MEITVFLICTIFGLILTLLGFRSNVISVFAVLFNLIVFGAVMAGGLSQTFAISTGVVSQTYDEFPSILLPALYATISFLKLVRYR